MNARKTGLSRSMRVRHSSVISTAEIRRARSAATSDSIVQSLIPRRSFLEHGHEAGGLVGQTQSAGQARDDVGETGQLGGNSGIARWTHGPEAYTGQEPGEREGLDARDAEDRGRLAGFGAGVLDDPGHRVGGRPQNLHGRAVDALDGAFSEVGDRLMAHE